MVVTKAAVIALLALGTAVQADDWDDQFLEASEAKVNPSHWINKACSGQSIRFSIKGIHTDRALNEFGSAMGLATRKIPVKKPPKRRRRNFNLAGKEETFGMSPAAPAARASWDYSNTNPKKGASCRKKLQRYARRYGNRLSFSNAPSGFFADLFSSKKPFHKTVARRMKQLGKSRISTNRQSRAAQFDGNGRRTAATPASSSGDWFSRLFGGSKKTQDKIRQARSRPRAQAPLGQRSLRTRSVPKPQVARPQKGYGERFFNWGRDQYTRGEKQVRGAFGSVAGGITENVNKIAGFFGTSGSGGRYVRKYTRRIMQAWHGKYGRKIQITSASRYSQGGRRDYSDVHKGHKRGLTLDVGSKGAAENARMLHGLYKAGAPVSRMLHSYNAAVISAAGRQYGSNSSYVQWLKRKLIYYKGHKGHIDVKFV